jgi:aspartate/methionine/tyrosine aminotransferase
VALIPGSGFGAWGEGTLRLADANSIENIQQALAQIKVALERLNYPANCL